MKYHIAPMHLHHVKEICKWKYPAPCDIYNLPSMQELAARGSWLVRLDKLKYYYRVVKDEQGAVIGSCCAFFYWPKSKPKKSVHNVCQRLGIMLRPDLCGKGNGAKILLQFIKELDERFFGGYCKQIEVEDFNTRAICCYQKAGFKPITKYKRRNQRHYTILMEYKDTK